MTAKDSVRFMSNNEANRITRESINTALLELMDNQDFDSITISALVKRAGVSRQSFYRNYTSKEDVIIEIEENTLKAFSDSLVNPKYKNNLKLWLLDYFKFVKKNNKLVNIINKADLSDMIFSKAPFIIEDWMGAEGTGLHYYVVGSLGSLRAVCMDWLANGMKESPEFMAEICMHYDIAKLMRE